MKTRFTNWARWEYRAALEGLKYPGAYLLAIKKNGSPENANDWPDNICYVGMTNSLEGLKGRLGKLHRVISSPSGKNHGGAARIRFRHPDYAALSPGLFVCVEPFECDLRTDRPESREVRGRIAKHEYDCIAEYLRRHGALPECNDMKKSPKK